MNPTYVISVNLTQTNNAVSISGISATNTSVISTVMIGGPAGTTNHLLLTNIGTNTHAQIDTHIASVSNPHAVTQAQVGLSNVDNTSDATKNAAVATLANKTLTSPKADFITDTSGGKEIELVNTASSANWVRLTNTTTGGGVIVGVNGTGSNEDLVLAALGTGQVKVGASQVTTATNTQTFTGKSIDAATNTVTNVANLSVSRQNDTTNSTITGARIETGWGVFAQGAVANKSEAVTFKTAFTTTPIVTISYGGDQTGGTIALGNGGNVEKGPITVKAYGESTSGFTAHAHTSDGTSWSATANVYYKWTAIGA